MISTHAKRCMRQRPMTINASSRIIAKNAIRIVTGLLISIVQNVASPKGTLNEANKAIPKNRTYKTSIKIITDTPKGLLR